ncbi:Glycosyltransferase family 36 [Ruminococcaceae bacterium YRB3002]|nr:Glycosyltransferase family 36 [Ruminococcaceae bacterium YRB3002]
MAGYEFIDNNGTFRLNDPDLHSYLYFPVCGPSGMMGSVTPDLGGDLKSGQNTFALEPVSSENLHNNRSTRNLWIVTEDGKLISACGASAEQNSRKFTPSRDKVTLTAGLLWHNVERSITGTGLRTSATTFVPADTDTKVELTRFTVTNDGDADITFTATAAVPIYGRSADNIRDHRNVTSMLNRMTVTEHGVVNNPTLTFDERGHKRNKVVYGVFAAAGDGTKPESFCTMEEDYIGEGGALDNPRFPVTGVPASKTGDRADGFEAMGAAMFGKVTLKPGESISYIVAIAIAEIGKPSDTEEEILSEAGALDKTISPYLNDEAVSEALEANKKYWLEHNNIRFRSGDKDFDNWMYWVAVQPILRRIFGCSFLPHHDYGKGGRGWRDLWQDCLALIIMDPSDVRQMLIDNFGGVRTDGTNATIIGSGRGEFIADRNGITRVWMDHAMWPFMTMDLYIRQTGDLSILDAVAPYFIDRQIMRGTALNDGVCNSVTSSGTVLEHLILQNLTAFFDVGENGSMKLRGADWNDALDMGSHRGESVAFTAAYAGNYRKLAQILRQYKESTGKVSVSMAEELTGLIGTERDLMAYCESVKNGFSGRLADYDIETLANDLESKAEDISAHIQSKEWFTDKDGYSRFNGYYDDNGRPLERSDSSCNMMLTSEVFTVMSGIATDGQIREIVKSADKYLYDASLGGYKLNTDFHEIKTDMGRMFGFAYGQKENGAVFCHMAVMFGNALYTRGYAKEGWKVIGSLYRHTTDFGTSRIYPGVPEYCDPKGRGVYHYLTGAASWLMLTVLTEIFGVKGSFGDMKFEPQLIDEQFDGNGTAGVDFMFNGKPVSLTYKKTGTDNNVQKITVNGTVVSEGTNVLSANDIGGNIEIELG